jgi:hypothetical protein
MDLSTLCRRVAEIRSQSRADPGLAFKLEVQFYVDMLRAIAKKEIEYPADFALLALVPQQFEYERWPT